jgi:predicted nucleic acid-binding protein
LPRKIVIDSSVFVAAFREQEPHSKEALQILQLLEKGVLSAIIPVSVIVEVVAAIFRRTQKNELAHQVGEKILSFPHISLIDFSAFRMAMYLDIAMESGLAGMDVIVVGTAKEFQVPLITFDKEMMSRTRNYANIIDINNTQKFIDEMVNN